MKMFFVALGLSSAVGYALCDALRPNIKLINTERGGVSFAVEEFSFRLLVESDQVTHLAGLGGS